VKKVLINGFGGFAGSHLIELYLEKGYRTKVFVRYNLMNRWGWLEESAYKDDVDVEVIKGNMRDYDFIYSPMEWCGVVFYFAALIGISYSSVYYSDFLPAYKVVMNISKNYQEALYG